MSSHSTVDVRRDYRAEFFEPVWVRAWHREAGDMARFRGALSQARSCSGKGVDDPYQIRVSRDTVTTLTVGSGVTLQERLRSPEFQRDEGWIRKLGEQLCLGILRLHDGLGERHGALCPFNIRVSDEGSFSIWSVPTVRLERAPAPDSVGRDSGWLRQAGRMAKKRATGKTIAQETRPPLLRQRKYDQEENYQAPEEPKGSFLSDVYSIGSVLYRVLSGEFALPRIHSEPSKLERLAFEDFSEELSDIIYKCLQTDPLDRFLGIKKLALALNPESEISSLHISEAQECLRRGIEQFQGWDTEGALESFNEAAHKDPFSVAVWNNLAAIKMRKGQWIEAIYDLEKAYELSATHPVISSNIAHCFLHLDDSVAVNHWAEQAQAMNPGLVRPGICLAEQALREGRLALSSSYAVEAVIRAPQSREARLCLARVHEARSLFQKAEDDRKHAALLDEEPPLLDALIDEALDPPWGPLREEDSGPGGSGSDGGEYSGVPRTPIGPRPRRSATRSLEDEAQA